MAHDDDLRRSTAAWSEAPAAPTLAAGDASTVDGRGRAPGAAADGEPGPAARYQLIAELGRGGMAVVHAALDRQLGRRVALKLVRPDRVDAAGRARLLREAQTLARLRHPNVVQVYDAGELGRQVFIAMELVDGGSLGRWLATAERSWPEIVRVFVDAGRGLAAAHAAGLVHRDFKPDNVLVDSSGQVRVADFGLAIPSDGQLADATDGAEAAMSITRTGSIVGTPAFMAPEQLDGKPATAAADQFAFCVALYRALYGAAPFAGDSPTSLRASIEAAALPPETGDRPRWLRAIVTRGLAVRPEDRHPSMEALLTILSRERGWRRWRWPLAASAAVVATGVAVTYAATRPDPVDPVARCDGGVAELRAIWNPTQRAAIDRHLTDLGSPLAQEARAIVDATLDRYAQDWSVMHRGACTAHARGAESSRVLDLRMGCVRARADELAAAIGILLDTSATTVGNATNVAAQLRPIADCAEVAALEEAIPPPRDPAVRATAARLRQRLAVAEALERGGRSEEALAEVRAIVAAARGLDATAIVVEASLAEGRILIARNEHEAARAALAVVEQLALKHGALAIAVEAAARHLYLDGVLGERSGLAERAALLEPLSEGLDGDHFARPLLLNNLGTAHLATGDVRRAHAYFERAHAIVARDPNVALELLVIDRNLAITDDRLGGEPLARAVWAQLERRIGAGNLLTLDAMSVTLHLTADPAPALAIARDYLERAARFHPTASALQSDVASYAGFLAAETDDLAAARGFHQRVIGLVDNDPEVTVARALAAGQLALLDHDFARARAAFAPLAAAWARRASWWERERGAIALVGLATAARALDDDATAMTSLDLAIEIFTESIANGNNQEPAMRRARAQLDRAALARAHRDLARADTLEAAAVAYYRATGAPAFADEIARHDH